MTQFGAVRLLVALLAITAAASCSFAQERPLPAKSADSAKIQRAESAAELQELYREFFKDKKDADLVRLESDENAGIALMAGWERIRRVIKQSDPKVLESGGQLHLAQIESFLQLAHKTLREPAPRNWKKALEHSVVRGLDRIDQVPQAEHLKNGYHKTELSLQVPKHTELEVDRESEIVVLSVEESRLRLSRKWLQKVREQESFDALVAKPCYDGSWLVMLHGGSPSSHNPVFHLDQKGQVLWQAEVWAGVLPARTGNTWGHWARLVNHDDRAYVFGITDFSLYIEGFSLKDGSALFRFSTSY